MNNLHFLLEDLQLDQEEDDDERSKIALGK